MSSAAERLAAPGSRLLRRQVFLAVLPDRLTGFALVVPALLFLFATFLAPIGMLLGKSVDNAEPAEVLVRTLPLVAGWNGEGLPPEPVFAAFAADLKDAQANRTAAGLGKRLNYEISGIRSRILSAARALAKIEAPPPGGWTEAVTALDPVWRDPGTWRVIQRNAAPLTAHYLLTSVDLTRDATGDLVPVDPAEAIFLTILGRTLFIAALVTLGTLLLGYPLAYVAAIAPAAVGAVLMLFVLLPLWTSLLVRTTAWVVLLQSNGVINDLMIRIGLTAEPLQLIFTRIGTLAAMIHIQLPFTVLPIYSVMRQIPDAQLKAARSLGAGPLAAFWRVYAPQTLPGVAAGCLITFILSLGYYITPALVGGATDQMMSNFISDFINRDLNWGLASALGTVLLLVTLALYAIYVRVLGADRIRLG